MTAVSKLPNYVRLSLLFIAAYFFVSFLYIAQDILLPIIYASIFAVSLSPLIGFLVRKKVNRIFAIFLVLFVLLLFVGLLALLISSQATKLIDAWPQLYYKMQEMLAQIISWISRYFDIAPQKVNEWINSAADELINSSKGAIGSALSTIGGVLTFTVIIPVYIFMVLLYQPHIIDFIHKLFSRNSGTGISALLVDTKMIIQSYLSGLFIEFVIVAVLNSIGLLLLGIEYAILLGIIGSLLNIIPYIGGIIGVLMFMVVALLTKPPIFVLYVVLLYSVIQLVDNNYIVPKIVGSKVKLNALVSIFVVFAGAALWGLSGMFLSIPLVAIIKLIFDRIEQLQPWGFLLGEDKTLTRK
jgi:predicted PurR-regulated permease PerM